MTEDIERLMMAAARVANTSGAGHAWATVVSSSGISQALADRFVATRQLEAHITIDYVSGAGGQGWQLTPSGQITTKRLLAAEAARPPLMK